jgi:hypothetical protein
MLRWLQPSAYTSLSLFALMGLFGTVVAWTSVGLVMLAMANIELLGRRGLMADVDGGLVQFATIVLKATVGLAAYLGFKVAEVELVRRWLGSGR